MHDDLGALHQRRIRLAAALALVDGATTVEEFLNASALARKTRARIHAIESALPYEACTITIAKSAGFGPIRLRLALELIRRLQGHVSVFQREHATFRYGDLKLTCTARADHIARIAQVVPDFLADVDAAAKAAARIHRSYLMTLPEEHHAPKDRDNLMRAYRRTYMDAYGAALIAWITSGRRPETADALGTAARGALATGDASADAATADMTRYRIDGPRRVFAIPAAS
ncbi:hypothetical protein GCM10010156_49420 [Planobispora rosea]|uniref:Uncharacterized protein n=1 Tax=Planobispora rosea TaxID=35762 RepID=A0A8J3S3H3_PLARO|nr:hypothetical protein [Planobispora rosea]GGS84921.1 hypothetical protein GCM10010156_49420 [Planobispora rosea]GIH86453.1 hypothetical protein Pro02_48610 [Planobispora rosea]